MRKSLVALGVLVTGLAGLVQAVPTEYSGSISTTDGSLVAHGPAWGGSWGPASLAWTVTETAPGTWHYKYTLTVPLHAVGRMIIEASDGDRGSAFTQANLLSPAGGPIPWTAATLVATHGVVPGNPGMPEDMYGIQLDAGTGLTTLVYEFDSDRSPVWGDFYARTAGEICPVKGDFFSTIMLSYLYNAGFTIGDVDPGDGPGDGSLWNHILVPDSVIPAPGAIALSGLGLVFLAWLRRKGTF